MCQLCNVERVNLNFVNMHAAAPGVFEYPSACMYMVLHIAALHVWSVSCILNLLLISAFRVSKVYTGLILGDLERSTAHR